MKTVFLILYLWHADRVDVYGYRERSVGLNGGPVLKIEAMPSLRACEAVGAAAKALADQMQHGANPADDRGLPAVYRCVEVAK